MKARQIFVTLALVAATFSFATESHAKKNTNKKHKTPTLLNEIENKYEKAATLIAHFDQTESLAALKREKKSAGRIMAKRPGKLRWETTQPFPSTLVSDGNRTWFYTPPMDESEPGTVIESKASASQTKLTQMLLSGAFSLARDVQIESDRENAFWLTLKPGSAGDVTRARIEVDPSQKLIRKVDLSHKDGNKTEISLTEIELGKEIPDDAFVFVPPPNTDRVKK